MLKLKYLPSHLVNPLSTGELFHYYMLDKSICHFKGVWSTLSLLFYFLMEYPVSKQCRPLIRRHVIKVGQGPAVLALGTGGG